MHRKLPLTFRNRTNYFNPSSTACWITVANPNTQRYKDNRIEGFETRLYYEYKYCESVDGQTIFLTFTYNDKAIPKYRGKNVFDYEHLVYLLNGGLKQYLKRNYGTKFKYFVGPELGEGAGKRGYANNPHYHILFFLRPDDSNDALPYVPIAPLEFLHLCRLYWQGFDQDVDRRLGDFHSFKKAKYGIVKEGKYGIKVNSFRACVYCAKYVLKDSGIKKMEQSIIADAPYYDARFVTGISLAGYGKPCLVQWHNWSLYQAQQDLRIFRNRFSNKPRISNGVGDYALQFIDDELNPLIPMPDADKEGKLRPLSLYYYRKLYFDVVKDDFGLPLYVLNQKGIRLKLHNILSAIKNKQERTLSLLTILNKNLYDFCNTSDFGSPIDMDYFSFVDNLNSCDLSKVIERYAQYKLIYQYRYWQEATAKIDRYFPYSEYCSYCRISPITDYANFITPQVGKVRYDCFAGTTFVNNTPAGYHPYSAHIYFAPYMCFFDLFDSLTYYVDIQKDNKLAEQAERNRQIYNFHKRHDLNQIFKAYDS